MAPLVKWDKVKSAAFREMSFLCRLAFLGCFYFESEPKHCGKIPTLDPDHTNIL